MKKAEFGHLLDGSFGDDVKKHLAQIVARGYPDAVSSADSQGIAKPFRDHSIPQQRCYLIQQRVYEEFTEAKYPGITVSIRYHGDKGTEPYTVLSAGGVHLTVSMVRSRWRLPRPTPFRQANALNTLFSSISGEDTSERYVILSHVPSPNNQHLLHLDLLVPNSRYKGTEFVFDWSPLVEFEKNGVDVPSEEVKPAELKFKGQQQRKAEGA